MKQLRKLASLLLVAALVMGTLFIPEQAFAAKYPGLKQDSIRLTVGQSKTLTLKNAKGLKVKFYSVDSRIATVSKKGKVTAKKEGMTTIHATIDGKWPCECRVYVDPKPVAKKTVKWICPNSWDGAQTHVVVERTVKDAPFEITISTESEDENLNLTVYEATSGNGMSVVGKIGPDAKKLTLTATKTIIIESATWDVRINITVKTKDGKKTIKKVTVVDV